MMVDQHPIFNSSVPKMPVPGVPSDQPPAPIVEPEPDDLPDEAPLPNPDENDNPAKILMS